MGDHQSANMKEETWLTPPELLSTLGSFDLDPCSPIQRPWETAAKHYTVEHDGLKQPWHGRVWCNPPYGRKAGQWLARLADHGNGIALIFAFEAFYLRRLRGGQGITATIHIHTS